MPSYVPPQHNCKSGFHTTGRATFATCGSRGARWFPGLALNSTKAEDIFENIRVFSDTPVEI